MSRCTLPLRSLSIVVAVLCAARFASAASEIDAAREKGVNFLKTTQSESGSWTTDESVGITGLVLTGLLDAGLSPDDETAQKALKYLEARIHDDGGIYADGSRHRNYETCIVLVAFSKANADGRYQNVIDNAEAFLRGVQWDESEGVESSDVRYGGAGYGGMNSRPDLSNTSFLIDALKEAGVGADDSAMQKALVFVSRCQNLESEHNQTEFAGKVNDGGFYYTPAAGGTSQAGEAPSGGLRSYGSMTYAGLKSMIYAGLSPEDPRVTAATEWIRKHYTLEENPGMGANGLFYYYQTFAKALDAAQLDSFKDASGTEHDWRSELAAKLISLQKENGSWVNETGRWMEGDPNLVTAYTLLALKYCDAPAASE